MLIEQQFHKISYKKGQARLWLESKKLFNLGLKPGMAYNTEVNPGKNLILIKPSLLGNIVSFRKKKDRVIPIIDKSGPEIREALKDCHSIKITFYKSDSADESWVKIEGVKDAAHVVRNQKGGNPRELTSITFCAGAGIASVSSVDAGFKEIAGIEWNPKVGSENRWSDIYSKNHPESICFNVPLEEINANDLPDADLWLAGLDCTDFSVLASSKKDEQFLTMDLFMHLAALFKQRDKSRRPVAIMIENVPGFSSVGLPLKVFFRKYGYSVTTATLNSLDFGSRTERKRYFFVACAYEGFSFPEGTGRKETPIVADGIITLENLDWITAETDLTLKYFLERNDKITHNHKICAFDITKDTHVGTIPKSHGKKVPENLIKHPHLKDTYAFLNNVDHLRYLHGIRNNIFLGDSKTLQMQSIGQGVDVPTFYEIIKKLYDFMKLTMFKKVEIIPIEDKMEFDDQLCLGF